MVKSLLFPYFDYWQLRATESYEIRGEKGNK